MVFVDPGLVFGVVIMPNIFLEALFVLSELYSLLKTSNGYLVSIHSKSSPF